MTSVGFYLRLGLSPRLLAGLDPRALSCSSPIRIPLIAISDGFIVRRNSPRTELRRAEYGVCGHRLPGARGRTNSIAVSTRAQDGRSGQRPLRFLGGAAEGRGRRAVAGASCDEACATRMTFVSGADPEQYDLTNLRARRAQALKRNRGPRWRLDASPRYRARRLVHYGQVWMVLDATDRDGNLRITRSVDTGTEHVQFVATSAATSRSSRFPPVLDARARCGRV